MEQKMLEWCVNYVRDLLRDDHEEVMIGWIIRDTGLSEADIFDGLETLVPERVDD